MGKKDGKTGWMSGSRNRRRQRNRKGIAGAVCAAAFFAGVSMAALPATAAGTERTAAGAVRQETETGAERTAADAVRQAAEMAAGVVRQETETAADATRQETETAADAADGAEQPDGSDATAAGTAVLLGAGIYTAMRKQWKEKKDRPKEYVYFENHTKNGTLLEEEKREN